MYDIQNRPKGDSIYWIEAWQTHAIGRSVFVIQNQVGSKSTNFTPDSTNVNFPYCRLTGLTLRLTLLLERRIQRRNNFVPHHANQAFPPI